jgi:hypothetical protein
MQDERSTCKQAIDKEYKKEFKEQSQIGHFNFAEKRTF